MYQKRLNKIQNNLQKTKLFNSPYWVDVVDMVKEKNMMPADIIKALEAKGWKASYPTVLDAVCYIRANQDKALALAEESKKVILQANDELKQLAPSMTNIFKRRASLVSEIMNRKKELLRVQNEGERVVQLITMLEDLRKLLSEKDNSIKEMKIAEIAAFVKASFQNNKINPAVESLIRQYIHDQHEIFCYVETITGKLDVFNLIDKLSISIVQACIEDFKDYIKNDKPENREVILNKFKQDVKEIVNDIKVNDLKISDDDE